MYVLYDQLVSGYELAGTPPMTHCKLQARQQRRQETTQQERWQNPSEKEESE